MTPQKDKVPASPRRFGSAVVRVVGLASATAGMAIVGYLISQEFDGYLTAALAGALAGVVLIARGR